MRHVTVISVNSHTIPLQSFGHGVPYSGTLEYPYPIQYADVVDGALKVTGLITLPDEFIVPGEMTVNQGSPWTVSVNNLPPTYPVTGTFWQTVQPISASTLPLPTGAATEAKQADNNVLVGAVNETAPGTDTASSGLNGRLQRIAQRLSSLVTALGSPFQAGGSIGNTAFGVNNGAGAAAVNIQDGGNSITIDAPSLPLPTGAATAALQAQLIGAIDATNSTTAPLNAGISFTGEWVDVSGRETVLIALATDQNCTFTAQFSTDGTNIDSSLVRYYTVGKINAPQPFVATRKYFRLVITNTSASNQTYLRAQTTLGSQSTMLNIPVDSIMSQTYPAFSTRPTDWHTETALGRRQGVASWQKFGFNPDLDTTDGDRTIWPYKTTGLTPLTTARTLSIASDSANDTSAGTGLRSVRIFGIDSARNEQTEDVTLNGVTPVVTTNTWLGVNQVMPLSAGSGFTNAGNITFTATTDSTVQAYIPTGVGISQQCFIFTPASTKFLTTWLVISCAKLAGGAGSPRVTIKGYVRDFTTGCRYEIFRQLIDTSVVNDIQLDPKIPFVVPGSSLLEFTASTDTNNTPLTMRFGGEIHDDIGT